MIRFELGYQTKKTDSEDQSVFVFFKPGHQTLIIYNPFQKNIQGATMYEEHLQEVEINQLDLYEKPQTLDEAKSQFELRFSLMKEEFDKLEIKDVNDKEGLRRIHNARMQLVHARNAGDKKYKELTEKARDHIREVLAVNKFLTKLIKPLEDSLKTKEDWVEEEKVRIAEQKIVDLVYERLRVLTEAGVVKLTEKMYRAGKDYYIETDVLRTMNDDDFNDVVQASIENIKLHKEELQRRKEEEARREEELRLQIEENNRLAKQKAEQQQKEAELRAEAQYIALQKAEAVNTLIEVRLAQLPRELSPYINTFNGLKISFKVDTVLKFGDKAFSFKISEAQSIAANWSETISGIQKTFQEAQEARKFYEAYLAAENQRKAKETADAEAAKAFLEKAEEEKRRLLAMSDREKFIEFIKVIDNIEIPSAAGESGIKLGSEINGMLARLSAYVRKAVEKL